MRSKGCRTVHVYEDGPVQTEFHNSCSPSKLILPEVSWTSLPRPHPPLNTLKTHKTRRVSQEGRKKPHKAGHYHTSTLPLARFLLVMRSSVGLCKSGFSSEKFGGFTGYSLAPDIEHFSVQEHWSVRCFIFSGKISSSAWPVLALGLGCLTTMALSEN